MFARVELRKSEINNTSIKHYMKILFNSFRNLMFLIFYCLFIAGFKVIR